MNTHKISPDDPRLTAYALNEMGPAERVEFEPLLAQDVDAQQAVVEIRDAAVMLASVLETEPDMVVVPPAPAKPARDPYARIIRFPYWTVSSLAAACFAMAFIYWQRQHIVPESKHYIEVPLTGGKANEGSVAVALPTLPAEPEAVAVNAPAGGDEVEKKVEFSLAQKDRAMTAKAQILADRNDALQQDARRAAAPAPMTLEAQTMRAAGASVVTGGLAKTDEVVALSPFTVSSQPATGYLSRARDIGAISASAGQEKRNGMTFGVTRAEPTANTEAYAFRRDNNFLRVADQPVSTFAADVDTASYANVRRFLLQGQRPPADAVRIEELVNYFSYNYAGPQLPELHGDFVAPVFTAHLEVAGAPWAPTHRLVRIGLKGRELSEAARPAANLVFLLDVSGSMNEPNKLPLVKQSLRLLVDKLRPDDHVAIAVYAGASGLALPSTPASHKAEIIDAIERLEASGSTNGAAGIQLAYDIAKANFVTGGVNRVILATDGDWNVGTTSEGDLVRLVGEKAKSGVFLTVLGFGMGNYKDSMLEQLADKGNGNYAYIDSLAEAKKTLVEQAGGTLVTIAKDVKLQVEFNPALVQAYRLIGYENRLLAREDFNNDKVDAGEVGSGHTVTALYEVVPVGVEMPEQAPAADALKYQKTEDRGRKTDANGELLTVKLRFKDPAGDTSRLLEFPLRDSGAVFAQATQDFKFAAAVAAFGMVLRDSPHKGTSTFKDVEAWGREGLGNDAGGYRSEFLSLVERAEQVGQ